LIPVTVNGAPKLFLLDTGGYMSQVAQDTATELKMELHNSEGLRLYDVSGEEARKYVIADSVKVGSMTAPHFPMMAMPGGLGDDIDGIISTDLMLRYDVDIDFGSGLMRYFSPDHCPGKVVYWNPPAVAAVPITVQDRYIKIPVKLDGQEFRALVDTGATRSTISRDNAKAIFGLDGPSSKAEKGGPVNGDSKLTGFTHVFHSLSFNGIDVSNPKVLIMPDRVNSASREQQTGNRALLGSSDLKLPELILGMDILRHLHIYMAFREKQFYVSAGSPPRKPSEALAMLDQAVAFSPSNPGLLNSRCFVRGLQKAHLDEALQDCELALKSKPQYADIIDSEGLVLYELGRYPEARTTYNRALAIKPDLASSLFMRGYTKRKLGDAAGGDADIAAAKTLDADVPNTFREAGLPAE
jgi:predicted aspartyl protease